MKLTQVRIEYTKDENTQGYIWRYGDEIEGLLNAQRWLDDYIKMIHNPLEKVKSASLPILHD